MNLSILMMNLLEWWKTYGLAHPTFQGTNEEMTAVLTKAQELGLRVKICDEGYLVTEGPVH